MAVHRLTSSGWEQIKSIYRLVANTGWSKIKTAYRLTATGWVKVFGGKVSPTQTSSPSLTGTGVAFTTISRSAGTYSNYQSLTTRIYSTTDTTTPTDGETAPITATVITTNPYTVTQQDGTPPASIFYAVDKVLSTDGVTYYYYYSQPITASIGTITDNYNRTVSSGLGTMSSGYIYSSYSSGTAAWSVDGTRGRVLIPGSSYPMQTVDTGSANKTVKLQISDAGGGMGISLWVTSGGSYWATFPYYDYDSSAVTLHTCTGSVTGQPTCPSISYGSCHTPNSNDPSGCISCGGGLVQCPNSTTDGDRCGACTSGTSTVYSTQCLSEYGTSDIGCPDEGDHQVGDRCGVCSESYPCNGTTQYGSSCADGPGTASGQVCDCTMTTNYVCNSFTTCTGYNCCNNISQVSDPTGPNQKCGNCYNINAVSYPCTGYSSNNASCPDTGNLSGDRCQACTSSTTTTYSWNTNQTTTVNYPASYPCGTDGGTTNERTSYDCGPFLESNRAGGWCNCRYDPVTQTLCNVYWSNQSTCSGSNCSGCTSSTIPATYGSCHTPRDSDGPDCIRGSCGVGYVQCPTSYQTVYSYYTNSTSTVASWLHDTRGYKAPYSVTQQTCSGSASGSSCPGTGSADGQRCSSCSSSTSTSYSYPIRVLQYSTTYPISTTSTSAQWKTTNTRWSFKIFSSVASTTTTYSYNVIAPTSTTQYTYNAKLKLVSSSGYSSTQLIDSATNYSYDASLYPSIYGVSAETSGNSVTAKAYSDLSVTSQYGSAIVASNSGTKGTSFGVIQAPSAVNKGTMIDNLSIT